MSSGLAVEVRMPWGHVPVASLWATNWLIKGMSPDGGSHNGDRCTLCRTSYMAAMDDPKTCQRNGDVRSPCISTGPA